MSESLRRQAEAALRDVVEGTCPLCLLALSIHDGRACCPCCGDSYVVTSNSLEIRRCPEHGRDCEHWEKVWAAPVQ